MHRKEVTHSDGSYERKSRGRKLADEMGRGKKKIPLYSVTWGRKIEEIYFLCTLQGVFHSPVLFRDGE